MCVCVNGHQFPSHDSRPAPPQSSTGRRGPGEEFTSPESFRHDAANKTFAPFRFTFGHRRPGRIAKRVVCCEERNEREESRYTFVSPVTLLRESFVTALRGSHQYPVDVSRVSALRT